MEVWSNKFKGKFLPEEITKIKEMKVQDNNPPPVGSQGLGGTSVASNGLGKGALKRITKELLDYNNLNKNELKF